MQKTVAVVALVALAGLLGCRRQSGSPQAPQPKPKQLVDDPVAAVKVALPDGWAVWEVVDDPKPFYRPSGKGKLIVFSRKRPRGDGKPSGVHLYIMSPDYQDGGEDPTRGHDTQSWPPTLVHDDKQARIYLWPGPNEPGWESMKQDLLDALLK